jgi:hypothetical protein
VILFPLSQQVRRPIPSILASDHLRCFCVPRRAYRRRWCDRLLLQSGGMLSRVNLLEHRCQGGGRRNGRGSLEKSTSRNSLSLSRRDKSFVVFRFEWEVIPIDLRDSRTSEVGSSLCHLLRLWLASLNMVHLRIPPLITVRNSCETMVIALLVSPPSPPPASFDTSRTLGDDASDVFDVVCQVRLKCRRVRTGGTLGQRQRGFDVG